ncbi:MAG: DUF3830 family protein [archaeon]
MSKKIEISLGKARAVAELLEDQAPKTCEMILNLLPVDGPAHHSSESGRVAFVELPRGTKIEHENQTIYEIPGDVFVYNRPVIHIEPQWPLHERARPVIGWVYEKDTQIQGYPGGPAAVNLFATVIEGLDALGDEAPRMRREGFENMRVRRL